MREFDPNYVGEWKERDFICRRRILDMAGESRVGKSIEISSLKSRGKCL